jgi:hypothetical protein
MLPASSLSRAAYGLRDRLVDEIDELINFDQVKIGHPGDTIKTLEDSNLNCLNLFFYDAIYDGYPADGTQDDPFYVRLHCLITAIGEASKEPEGPGGNGERNVSKGENELRLIGEVMRVLHEQPVLSVNDANENEIAQLQVVPHPMNLDNLNHIWSTQNEISYRLSVAYEMALVPVPFALAADRSPLVGDSQMVVWGDMTRETRKEKEGAISLQPEVEYLEIDTKIENWMPHICMVEQVDAENKLHYVFKFEGNPDDAINILIAADDNEKVKLFWNVWCRKSDNKIVAWKEDIPDSVAPLEKEIINPTGATEPFFPNRIDPADIDARRIFQVKLPDEVKEEETKSWQAMLYAVREWRHKEFEDSEELIATPIRSNSLLFYGVGS